MGNTLARMNGLMVMRANSPAPVFSDLPASMVDDLRKIPGSRIVAPEVWQLCPSIDGRNLLAKAADSGCSPRKAPIDSVRLRRDDPDRRDAASRAPPSQERRLRAGTAFARKRRRAFSHDGRRRQAQRPDQHQDRPRLPQLRRLAQESRRLDLDRRQEIRRDRPLRNRLALDRYDHRHGYRDSPGTAQARQEQRLRLLRRAAAAR